MEAGRWNTVPLDQDLTGQEIAIQKAERERKVAFVCLSCDEAWRSIPGAGQWMTLTENAAPLAHTYVPEVSQVLPKEPGPHAQEGRDILEGMYAPGCTMVDQARIPGGTGMWTQRVESGGMGSLGAGIGIQSEQRQPTPVPSDEDDEDVTNDQARLMRRVRNGRRPAPGGGTRSTDPATVPQICRSNRR
jgi:hypothetical protein